MADINNCPSRRLNNAACEQSGWTMATTLVADLAIAEHWLKHVVAQIAGS